MRKQLMLKVYLVAFVIMIAVVAFLARKAEAKTIVNDLPDAPQCGATLYPTVTGLSYGTPTAYTSPTKGLYMPCSPVPDTTGLVNGTKWIMHTGTALGTMIQPTKQPSVTMAYYPHTVLLFNQNSNMVTINFTGTWSSDLGGGSCAFNNCYESWNTHLNIYTAYLGFRNDRGSVYINDFWISESSSQEGDVTVYYQWSWPWYGAEFNCLSNYGEGSGSVVLARGGIHFNVTCRGPSNWNGQQYQLAVAPALTISKYPNSGDIDTPTPTPFVCDPIPDYGGDSNPIASFPPISYSYGGCTQILPAVHIPLGGLFGMPDVDFPGMSLCIMWVNIVATFMGINITVVLSAFITMGMGFAIFNEFRS